MNSNLIYTNALISDPKLFNGDIPPRLLAMACEAGSIAWDIETSGLDWRTNQIATCQLFVIGAPLAIVRINQTVPQRLKSLLENETVRKVFHHAMFDLRFMASAWAAKPQNIVCTKIAAKLADEQAQHAHSLKAILDQYLGVSIDKTEQVSDWLAEPLSKSQIEYATRDVLYLPDLLNAIEQELDSKGLLSLARQCFVHIPTRVQLEVLGYPDIYTY